MLQALCLSDMGRLHCQAMEMMTDYSRLVPVLRRVNEMKGIVAGGALPLQAVASPSESIAMLKAMGSHISAERFADLAAFLHTAGALRRFFADDEDHSRPELTRRFRNIPTWASLSRPSRPWSALSARCATTPLPSWPTSVAA